MLWQSMADFICDVIADFKRDQAVPDFVSSLDPDGTLSIWYVARLRKLTEDMPSRWVPLDSVNDLDENLWFNTFGEVPTCRAIAEHAKRIYEARLEYPVILSPNGEVMDGMHRVAKAWLLGMKAIEVVQLDEIPPPDKVIPRYELAQYAGMNQGKPE